MHSNVTSTNREQLPAVLENCNCPICGSAKYRVLAKALYPTDMTREQLVKIYRSSSEHKLMDQLVECTGCQLVYLNPRPRGEIILESYSSAEDPVFFEQNPMRIATFKRALARLSRRFDIPLATSTRVLDVGCAGGAFPKAAHDLGCSVVGVEPSRWLSQAGREAYGLDIRAGVLSDHSFEPSSFDVVTLWDVIEHLLDPNAVLAQVRALLRPGGLLVVNYPDYGSIAARLLGNRWPFLLSVHLFYFTRVTIRRLLETAGFEVKEISPFFQTLGAAYVSRRASAYFGAFRYLEQALKATGREHLPLTYNIGQSLVVSRVRA